ncbi:hypothetical protein A6A11_04985 [Bisgaardia hudsonensis]|nr:hypothetical protein A6A11_04985 [Bisgaardia hudsonensis]
MPDKFLPYLKNGIFKLKVLSFTFRSKNDFHYYIIYRPEHIDYAEELALVLNKSFGKIDLDLERKIGQLLGYNENDIEFYIQNALLHFKHQM